MPRFGIGYPIGMARIGGIGLVLAALALLWALHTFRPEPAPPAPPPQALPEASPVAEPPLAAALPAKPAPAVEPWLRVELETPAQTRVPLEKLLHWDESRPAARGLDLAGGQAGGAPEAEALAAAGLGKRVYLQRRTDEVGPGDRQRKLETTDVGVRLPVAPSVELRGGMRLESRQDGDPEAATTEPTPTVGVGVNF